VRFGGEDRDRRLPIRTLRGWHLRSYDTDTSAPPWFTLRGSVKEAEACLPANRLEEALAIGDRALRFSRERSERGYEAWALRFLGEVASHRDPPDLETAEGHYRQALALANELSSMRPLVAHCHFGLGKLCRHGGDGINARKRLMTAVTMDREMDMDPWLAQAEAEVRAFVHEERGRERSRAAPSLVVTAGVTR
jgi:tetratricopeptide (TPR) repeat protein